LPTTKEERLKYGLEYFSERLDELRESVKHLIEQGKRNVTELQESGRTKEASTLNNDILLLEEFVSRRAKAGV